MTAETSEVPTKPLPIAKPVLILGEGKDEAEFFAALLRYMTISNAQAIHYGGKDNLAPFLRYAVGATGFEQVTHLVVTRDADRDPNGALASAQNALRAVSLPVPYNAEETASSQSLHVGVYIMPGQGRTGALEDVCLQSLEDALETPCVTAFMECLEDKIPVESFPEQPTKTRMLLYLAAQRKDVTSIGVAAQKGLLDFQHPAFAPLINMLRKTQAPE